MRTPVLSIHRGLAGSSRFPVARLEAKPLDATALLLLVGAGVGAGLASALLNKGLGMPGHAILRAVVPMSLGLALVPRHGGGMVMGASALATVAVLTGGGFAAIGAGALTSLAVTGPALDLALRRAKPGWQLYLAFAAAGLGANLVAFVVRAVAKLGGFNALTARPFSIWWQEGAVTYPLFGLIAGLISAAAWFQFAGRRQDPPPRDQSP